MRWGIASLGSALVFVFVAACAMSPPADLRDTPSKSTTDAAPDGSETDGSLAFPDPPSPHEPDPDGGFPPAEGLDAAMPGTCPGVPFVATGLIGAKYAALGGCTGILGLPMSNELVSPDSSGRFNIFQEGIIVWSPATNAQEVHGRIYNRWKQLLVEMGPLGYPITDETPTPDGVGRFNVFQRGSIYWSPATDAYEVIGRIRDKYRDMGWEAGPLGYPVSGETAVPTGRKSDFQRGSITWNMTSDTFTVTQK